MSYFKFRRAIAFLVLFTFLWTQMASPQELELANQPNFQPTKTPNVSPNAQATKPLNQIPQTTEQFLQDTLTLTPVSEQKEEKAISPTEDSKNQDLTIQLEQGFEYERYDFKDALDLLRPEYASAVIVKSLTSEDLHALAQLFFETGIIVLDGEIVLFTSGSSDEIGVLAAVRELVKKATFISHTHVDQFAKEGPSGQDLNEAILDPEYVITRNGVYAYNKEGILNNGDPYSYGDYIDQLNQAVQVSKGEEDQVQARSDLNQFIKDQDQYNLAPQSEKQTLLMGGTLTFTSGLTSANVTTLPGSPYPYFMSGSSSGTTLAVGTDGRFQLGYNVSTTGTYSGMTISFDNASTTTVETQNLSTFTNVVFGLQGPATALKLEFVDINGNKDSYTLTNISSTTEQFWSMATSTIVSTVDKTRIKQINLFVDQSTTTSTTLTGTMYIRSNGLNTNAPTQPVVTSTVPTSTNKTTLTLSGIKDANTAILINGTTYVALNSSTTWTATVSLSVEGNNTFNIQTKSSIGKLSTVKSITVLRDTIVPTGSITINSGATYTNSTTVTLNLSATDSSSGINTMSFSNDNITYSTPEAYNATKTYTLPTGDGTKTVYVKFYDKAGNVSAVYSKLITLDTTLPAINLVSATLSNSSNYTLTYTVDGVTKQEQITLQEGKNYIVRSSADLAGNNTTKTFQISLDAQPPIVQSLQINQGSSMTKSANVTLSLIAYDLGTSVTQMSFSNDGVNYSTPETFAITKAWTLTDGRAQKTIWVKVKDASGFWSNPVSATIFYQKVLTLDDFDGTSQVQNYWDGSGYQRSIVSSGAYDGTHAMQVNFQKTSLLPYSYFALVPKQDGVANDFSTYRTLRIQLNKLHLAPMVLMAKFEFNGTSQTFETQVGVPQGTYGWQDAVFDFSTVSPSLLANVKDILFFVDPGNPSTQGSFMVDSIRLDEWPETKVVDDFEGNNIPLQTYWDSNGSLIYQRAVTETNSYDGTHSMKVTYTKKPGYPYSFFAWTPKQNGVDNNFTNYGSLRFNLNKISSSPMVIMMKLEFNGTTQTFEEQLSFPQGSNQWQEVVFDLSQVSASLLASVKNVLFFVDPASETTAGSFYMDRIRLAERTNEELLDDFEGNSSLVQTYWDGDGAGTVYTRTIDNTQGFDGTHSMQVNYNKSAQYPTSFFALTPKQDGIANDFSRYNVLKIMVKKDTLPLMRLMMKFDLDGTQINFEEWKEIPQGQTGWTELDYDFSSLDPSILKKVRNVLFFVDPMFYTTPQVSQGTFHIDSIKLSFQSDLPAKQFDPTRPPQVGWISSSVAADIDNEYHVGSLVRINAWELNAAGDLLDGTVRVFSKSTGYDSGEQRLIFTHDGQFWPFHWDTTGLKAADDYGVIVTMKDKSGNITTVGTETSPALTIKLTKGVPSGGDLLQVQDL